MAHKLKVGSVVPDFTLQDENGEPVTLSDFRGKAVVLYFYPKDDTPGCTKESCAFRDQYTAFTQGGAEVLGVSGDPPASHKAFKEKYRLPFKLLYDEGNKIRTAWGIPKDLFGTLPGRQTYVIDKDGVVKTIFNSAFKVEKHVSEALAALK